MRRLLPILLLPAIFLIVASCGESEPEGPPTFTGYPEMAVEAVRPYSVIFTTNLGRMTFRLIPEESVLAVNSFVFLVGQGFYNDMVVDRLVPGELAETGDPLGTGNAGYTYEVEPPQRPYSKGSLVMGNSGPGGVNGSKFFIILGDLTDDQLPPDYTIFGHLKADHKPSERTLEKIAAATVGPGADGELTVPQNPIEIWEVKVTEGCLPGMSVYSSGQSNTANRC